MPSFDDIRWFKSTFGKPMAEATAARPFGIDLLTALACQETGLVWSVLRRQAKLPTARLLELCVGDTVEKTRRAFPRSRDALLAAPDGQRMYELARSALLAMAAQVPAYASAARQAQTFCHGFGVFQRDLQHYLRDPRYFLDAGYADFDQTLGHAVATLEAGLTTLGWQHATQLSDHDQACLAIVYNTGRFVPARGLRQGWFDGKAYYGEQVLDFLRMARTVDAVEGPASLSLPAPNAAILPPATAITASGDTYEVVIHDDLLRLRREPQIDPRNPAANVLTRLPAGQVVHAVTAAAVNDFLEVETSLAGALYRGYASKRYLRRLGPPAPTPTRLVSAPPAVHLVPAAGTRSTRRDRPGAFPLKEAGQPSRRGATAAELRESLACIVAWLDVASANHLRYAASNGGTYASIYAHDYCHLAGVYLPRVWWTPGAVARIAQGEPVPVRYGSTVAEMQVNDLFRWLRDFGAGFGWRQTGSLSKLQLNVNQGATGLLIARRRDDGRGGQLVVVVPETATQSARRDTAGEVLFAVESGAGPRNFTTRVSRRAWWQDEAYAEWACWLHA